MAKLLWFPKASSLQWYHLQLTLRQSSSFADTLFTYSDAAKIVLQWYFLAYYQVGGTFGAKWPLHIATTALGKEPDLRPCEHTHTHPEHAEHEITLMSSEFHKDYAITFSMTTYITRYGLECCCMCTYITLWGYGVYGARRNLKLNLWENSRIAVVEVPLENLLEASVATQQPSW